MSEPPVASGKFQMSIESADEFATFVGLIRGEPQAPMFPVGTGGFRITLTSIEEFAALVALLRHEAFTTDPSITALTEKLKTGTDDLTAANT
jgi:hypothetical protein